MLLETVTSAPYDLITIAKGVMGVRGLDHWEYRIFKIGLFVLFVVTFGDYVFGKVWPVLGVFFGVK